MSSERQEINTKTPWWGEHLHRYQEVIKHLRSDDRVLDIACGNGYGTNLISKHIRQEVTGGDIALSTIEQCKRNFSESNRLRFEVMDATKLPFKDGIFDKIVSFETIEHSTAYEQMLVEFSRTLKRDGTVFISTPNSKKTSPDGIIKNPFHTQEFNLQQLQSILKKHFYSVKLFGQQYIRYKNKNGLFFKTAATAENLLYKKGIRKLPLGLQDSLLLSLINRPMYPTAEDYSLVEDPREVESCFTLFAICKKE